MSATRGEATLSTLGVSAYVLERDEIDDRAAPSLLPLLQDVPGVATSRSGQTGQQGSVFIRGGESRYARVMIDGVPVNQPGGAYDFGTALPFELERVEIVRGAASSLYGTDALAGVVSLQTRRAAAGDAPSLRAEGEGGSFDWQRWLGATSGARGAFDWNLGAQRLTTDNETPNSRFEQTAAALSAGLKLDERTQARAVVRFDDSTAGTPGPTAFGPPDQDASFEREDLVLSATLRRVQARVSQQLSLGYSTHRPALAEPRRFRVLHAGVGGPAGCLPDVRLPEPERLPEPDGSARRRLPGGPVARNTPPADGRGRARARDGRPRQPLRGPAAAGAHQLRRVPAGPRAARHARVPDARRPRREQRQLRHARRPARGARACACARARTPRRCGPAPAWGSRSRASSSRTASRSSRRATPTSTPSGARPSTSASSSGSSRAGCAASLTYFHHDYQDQIAYSVVDFDTFEGTYVNLAHTRAQGLEVALEARPVPQLSLLRPVHAAGRRDPREPERLRSRLRGRAAAAAPAEAPGLARRRSSSFPRWSAGVTLALVGERADSDFVGPRPHDEPRLRAARRAPAVSASRERSRRTWSATTCSTRSTRRRSATPRSAAPCAAGCACAWAAAGGRALESPAPRRAVERWLRRRALSPGCCSLARPPSARAADPKPRRVASINLSADEVLVAILPPERLVSVTQWADAPGRRTSSAASRPASTASSRRTWSSSSRCVPTWWWSRSTPTPIS